MVAVALLCNTACSTALTGVIRALEVQPGSCTIRPSPFSPQTTFYVVECPAQVKFATLKFTSSFHVVGDSGKALKQPLNIGLTDGDPKLVRAKACAKVDPARSCTDYIFDMRRIGSSEASLRQLIVLANGKIPIELLPPFVPSRTNYDVKIPYGATATIAAQAAKGGFASFDSLAAAERHTISMNLSNSVLKVQRIITIYVASANKQGDVRYTLDVQQRANNDAALSVIRCNIGNLYPSVKDTTHQYVLEVPDGTRNLGLSATAHDIKGASVTLHGSTGLGYASLLLDIPVHSPYALVHINIVAADQETVGEYVVVVISHDRKAVAMLQSLDVMGCIDDLKPEFEMSVHNYRCTLGRRAFTLHVTPSALWFPEEQAQMSIRVQGHKWLGGQQWAEPLDRSGFGQVSVTVISADHTNKVTYTIEGRGFPLEQRIGGPTTVPSHKFTITSPRFPRTTTPQMSTAQITAAQTLPVGTVYPITTTAAGPTQKPWRFKLPRINFHVHFPTISFTAVVHVFQRAFAILPTPSMADFFRALICLAFVALLASEDMTIFASVLKQLQFLALASELLEPESMCYMFSRPFDALNLWIPVRWVQVSSAGGSDIQGLSSADEPGIARKLTKDNSGSKDPTQKGQKYESEQSLACLQAKARIGNIPIICICSPVLALGLVIGLWLSYLEESQVNEPWASIFIIQRWHPRVLPVILFCLDSCLIGFTDSVAALLYPACRVQVHMQLLCKGQTSCEIQDRLLLALLLVYPVSFSLLSLIQLYRLRATKRLVWSPLLRLLSDFRTTSISLHGPSFNVAFDSDTLLGVLRWLFATEIRNAVPVQDPEGGNLQLGHTWTSADCSLEDCFLGEPVGALQPSELEAGLLPYKMRQKDGWLQHQERLGLELWIERRCAAHQTLKQQIAEAEQNGAITDSQGVPIFDSMGDPLVDLCQYCAYQFPSRPWLGFMRDGSQIQYQRIIEPVETEASVVATWVPPARDIKRAERRQMDMWLNRWLSEGETVSKAREECSCICSLTVQVLHIVYKQ